MEFTYEDSFGTQGLEPYERLMYDAMLGDRTLFTDSEGIERLWAASAELLDDPPPLHRYAPGSYGPQKMHELIAPRRWWLPVTCEEHAAVGLELHAAEALGRERRRVRGRAGSPGRRSGCCSRRPHMMHSGHGLYSTYSLRACSAGMMRHWRLNVRPDGFEYVKTPTRPAARGRGRRTGGR